MDQAKLDAVISKIKKLMALSRSPNEHEAASAAERAQSLLAEYNLSQSDVTEERGDGYEMDGSLETTALPWRRSLGTGLAKLYFTRYFYTTLKRISEDGGVTSYDVHTFVGLPHNVTVAKIMFEYLIKTVWRLGTEGASRLPQAQRSPYRVSFCRAASGRLCARIAGRLFEAKNGGLKSETGTALMVLDTHEQAEAKIGAFIEKELEGGITTVNQKTASLHAQGTRDGDAAGERIGLDQQVPERRAHRVIGRS